jgi:hypothetical protein
LSKAEEYRAKAFQFMRDAQAETDPIRRADLEWLAGSYRRLAEHADDVSDTYQAPQAQQAQQAQQQQQSKLEIEDKPTPEAE